jgi:membrane associated rhomboid family serine protease
MQSEASIEEAELPVPGGRRPLADEWALVLASEGIRVRIGPGAAGIALWVPSEAFDRAREALAAYARENAEAERAKAQVRRDLEAVDREPSWSGLWVGLALLAAFWLTGDRARGGLAFTRGAADASLIMAGEWWRCVTALTLHADLGHVLSNFFAGLYFMGAVCRNLGTGVGLALILASGIGGNALNAISHGRFHSSVGASTAVFGAIGLLAGLAIARRNRARVGWRRIWLPLGAALGLLAMLGTTGARVDLWAHFYGLAVGAAIGGWAGIQWPERAAPRTQTLAGVMALASIAFSWSLAMR